MRNLGLNLSFWLAAVALPTNSFALGLGEIEVNSFLNQPLKAEIEVISARPGEIDDLLVSLASRDAFSRAGLSRPQNLTELRFAVEKSEEGDEAVILVTTKKAIKEPFLNFLIEADWSKGRVLREFTVLLDPPFYAESTSTQTSSTPETTSAVQPVQDDSTPVISDESSNQSQPIAFDESSDTSQSSSDSTFSSASDETTPVLEGDIAVFKGDTLWGIASQYQDGEHSMGQIMLAIQRANPEAFGDNNINNLKVGSVIRAPDANELDALSKQEAYAQVLEQNGLWDDYVARVSGTSGSAVADGSDNGGSSDGSDDGELSLLTPGDGESDSSAGSGEDANRMQGLLSLAEEELDAAKMEIRELEARNAELEALLSKNEELEKMVQIEDSSLAQIQSDQIAEEEESAAVSEEMATADEAALLEELLAEDGASNETVGVEDTLVDDETAAVEESLTDKLAEDEASDALVEDQLSDESAVVVEETPPAPVIVTTPTNQTPSFLDGILPPAIAAMLLPVLALFADPIILGAIGGILLLLIILVIIKRRKQDDDSGITIDDANEADADDEELTPIHLAEATGEDTNINVPTMDDVDPVFGASDVDAEEEDEFSQTAIISQAEMPEPEDSSQEAATPDEQDDVLNEVDVYLAYGLYDNAEDLLNENLQNSPERADYRSKLLDTYYATQKKDEFVAEAETLKSMGSVANRYWSRVQVMGYELAPDNALFSGAKDSGISAADLEIAKPQAADFDLGADEDDTNFSNTDFNLGEESEPDFGLDTQIAETQELGELPDELPDLDSDEDDDTKIRGEEPAQESADLPDEIADLDFSFDDDEKSDDAAIEAADDFSAEMDFELPEELDLSEEDSIEEVADDMALDLGESLDDEISLDDPLALDGDETNFSVGEDLDIGAEEMQPTDVTSAIDKMEATAIMDIEDMPEQPTGVVDPADAVEIESGVDLGMDDTSGMMASDLEGDEVDDVELDLGNLDEADEFDVSLDADDLNLEDELVSEDFEIDTEDAVSMDLDDSVDLESEILRTGTFAPGDFDDVDEDDVDIDDIEDLMLPDDVDEVSTKLDLARAFIDMGDTEGARASLDEVLDEGNDDQKAEATDLIKHL